MSGLLVDVLLGISSSTYGRDGVQKGVSSDRYMAVRKVSSISVLLVASLDGQQVAGELPLAVLKSWNVSSSASKVAQKMFTTSGISVSRGNDVLRPSSGSDNSTSALSWSCKCINFFSSMEHIQASDPFMFAPCASSAIGRSCYAANYAAGANIAGTISIWCAEQERRYESADGYIWGWRSMSMCPWMEMDWFTVKRFSAICRCPVPLWNRSLSHFEFIQQQHVCDHNCSIGCCLHLFRVLLDYIFGWVGNDTIDSRSQQHLRAPPHAPRQWMLA